MSALLSRLKDWRTRRHRTCRSWNCFLTTSAASTTLSPGALLLISRPSAATLITPASLLASRADGVVRGRGAVTVALVHQRETEELHRYETEIAELIASRIDLISRFIDLMGCYGRANAGSRLD